MESVENKPLNVASKLCCRACLNTDCKLFNIHENNLADAFACISGIAISRDGLPQHLCACCSALMIKYMSFRTLCINSYKHLMSGLLKTGAKIDYSSTSQQHKAFYNLSVTAVETIDCIDVIVDRMKPEPALYILDTDMLNNLFDINIEVDENKVEFDNVTNKVSSDEIHIQIEVDNDNRSDVNVSKNENHVKIIEAENENGSDVTGVVVENKKYVKRRKRNIEVEGKKNNSRLDIDHDYCLVYEDADEHCYNNDDVDRNRDDDDYILDVTDDKEFASVKGKRRKIVKSKKKKLDTDCKSETNDDKHKDLNDKHKDLDDKHKDSDDKLKDLDDKHKDLDAKNDLDEIVNAKPVQVKKRREKKEVVTRKSVKKRRNPLNDFMPPFDFAAFENTYGVKIVTLTKEEQLAEIEARKSSDNYKESPFRCEDCGKGFLVEAAFNNHRGKHSPSAGTLSCYVCRARFKKHCRLQQHQDLHRLKFICQECSFVSRSRGQARGHHDVHAGKTFSCKYCGKTFTKSSSYLGHVRLAHSAEHVACEVCGETFIGVLGLRLHKTKMHKTQQFSCPSCPAKFSSSEALDRHTDTTEEHAGLRPCEQCGENCASEQELQLHVGEKHAVELVRCEECNQTFLNAGSYYLHQRRKHINERTRTNGKREYMCEQCGRKFSYQALFTYHLWSHRDVKPFPCSYCPKTFASKQAKETHERTHTGEKPYQCDLCPLAFSMSSNLDRHRKSIHLGESKHTPCHICGRLLSTPTNVRQHIRCVHSDEPWPKKHRKRKRDKQSS